MTELRPTILIVEDEPDIRRFLRASLDVEGYRVVESGTGRRGSIDAGTHKPDLAIVDLALRIATRDGEDVRLTPIEFRLLATLAKHLEMVVTHRQLLAEVWGPTHAADTHYLRIYMKQLRDKLETDPVRPRHLRTETGIGYRLVLDE